MRVGLLLAGEVLDDVGACHLLSECDHIVAADGGAAHALRLGVPLDWVGGDFDSLSPDGLACLPETTMRVRVPRAKDETDGELALRHILTRYGEDISVVVLGATGGRMDHEWATGLMLAALSRRGVDVTISDGRSLRLMLSGPITRHVVWPPVARETTYAVSLVPLDDHVTGVTYDGLAYPLIDASLPFGTTRGVSNEAESPHRVSFSLTLRTGTVLVAVEATGMAMR